MRPTLYRYNTETCKYERIRLKPLAVVWYAANVLLTAALMLAGLLVVHDFIFDSPREIALRKENHALQKNHITLTSHLGSIESSLALLHEKDQALHVKLFGTPLPADDEKNSGIADQQVLLADGGLFRKAFARIEARTSTLLRRSARTNGLFADVFDGVANENDPALFDAIPSAAPIQSLQADQLISGFGMRVNPFHKGLYEHPGVDLALPRDTKVIATAPGVVRHTRRSNLPAGYGNYVEIDHGFGFITRYAHLEKILVKQGQRISKEAVIGTIGSSGGSVAPHLHYEILRDGVAVDPVLYMIGNLTPDEHHRMKELSSRQNQSLD